MPDNLQPLPPIQHILKYACTKGEVQQNERRRDSQAFLYNLHGFLLAVRFEDDDYMPNSITIDSNGSTFTARFHKDGTITLPDVPSKMGELKATKPTEAGDLCIHWRRWSQPEKLVQAITSVMIADWHPQWRGIPEYNIREVLGFLLTPPAWAKQAA